MFLASKSGPGVVLIMVGLTFLFLFFLTVFLQLQITFWHSYGNWEQKI